MAEANPSPNKGVLQEFAVDNATEDTTKGTDEARAYKGVPREHIALNHSVFQYVREQAHTNGMESFWEMLNRGFSGTYHHMNPTHLQRYVDEFKGRHNDRPAATIEQMAHMVQGRDGKR